MTNKTPILNPMQVKAVSAIYMEEWIGQITDNLARLDFETEDNRVPYFVPMMSLAGLKFPLDAVAELTETGDRINLWTNEFESALLGQWVLLKPLPLEDRKVKLYVETLEQTQGLTLGKLTYILRDAESLADIRFRLKMLVNSHYGAHVGTPHSQLYTAAGGA